jgi:hypothetical protein
MKKKGKRSVFGWINNTLKYMHGNAEIALCDKHIANIVLNGKKLICFFKNQK